MNKYQSCISYSLPGELVYKEKDSDYGYFYRDANPGNIPAGKYGAFLHVKSTGAASGSTGFVRFRYTYRTPSDGPKVTNFYCGWETPWFHGSNRAGARFADGDESLVGWEKRNLMGAGLTCTVPVPDFNVDKRCLFRFAKHLIYFKSICKYVWKPNFANIIRFMKVFHNRLQIYSFYVPILMSIHIPELIKGCLK